VKKNFFIIGILLSSLCCPGQEHLLWEEQFEGERLDLRHWNYDLGNGCPDLCGWGNNERQIYTETNHYIKDGLLHIVAKKEDSTYTSTKITTKNKFQFKYGRVEARAKIPVGHGIWPALWMLGSNIDQVGWPLCGEVDILEYVGREPHQVFNSIHTKDSHGNTINTKKTRLDTIEEGFHLYAANWTPEKIDFFVDGDLLYTFKPGSKTVEIWPFDQPFYLILNVAIGGNFGGPEVDDGIFPQEFVVDYIKVFQDQ
jgi:beta-glucanase (GH16 family)